MTGTGRARGEAYGEQARDLIHEALDRFRDHVLGGAPGGADRHLSRLVDETGFRAAVEAHTPDLGDEVDGIARAAGVDGRELFALSLLDEEWWVRSSGDHHCTSFAVGGDRTVIGQNMDTPGWLDGLQVLLDIRPAGGPAALVPTIAGNLGLNALNEHGVGVCLNTLGALPRSTTGLPVSFLLRRLTGCPTRASAIEVLRTTPHASGQNYLLGDAEGVTDLECGSGWFAEYRAEVPFAHTNHPLVPGADGAEPKAGFVGDSAARHAFASEWLTGDGSLTDLMRRPPIFRGGAGDATVSLYGVVMECGADPRLQLTAGPPRDHPVSTYSFTR